MKLLPRGVMYCVHQPRKKEDLVYLGTTTYGTRVSINKHVAHADRVM